MASPYLHITMAMAMTISTWMMLTMPSHGANPMDFITTSCTTTQYPHLCLTTLSPHAGAINSDPVRLASTALNLTVTHTSSSLTVVTRMASSHGSMKPLDVAAVHDCMGMMSEAVDELKRSSEVMAHLGGQDLGDQVGNMQTWVSAALTNQNTCADGLRGPLVGDMKANIKEGIPLTSNALCFINALISN